MNFLFDNFRRKGENGGKLMRQPMQKLSIQMAHSPFKVDALFVGGPFEFII